MDDFREAPGSQITPNQGGRVGSTPIPGVKKCGGCGLEKPSSEFYQKGHELQSYCISCKVKAQARLHAIAKQQARQYLTTKGCKDCGNTDFRVLDFDHVDRKFARVSQLLGSYNWTSKKVQDEITRCEIRCANCHRIRHWNEDASNR